MTGVISDLVTFTWWSAYRWEVTCRQVLRRYRNVGRRSELEAEAYRSLIDVLSWEINVQREAQRPEDGLYLFRKGAG